jgi:hypothetical protein
MKDERIADMHERIRREFSRSRALAEEARLLKAKDAAMPATSATAEPADPCYILLRGRGGDPLGRGERSEAAMSDPENQPAAAPWAADKLTTAQIFAAYVSESKSPPGEAYGRPFAASLPCGRVFWYSTREEAEQEVRRAVVARLLGRTNS